MLAVLSMGTDGKGWVPSFYQGGSKRNGRSTALRVTVRYTYDQAQTHLPGRREPFL